MCTPQKYKMNLLLAKEKLNQKVLVNRRKSTAKRTTGWKSEKNLYYPLLCRRVPYSLPWDSKSQQLPELTNSAPSPLISSVAQAVPCHKNTFQPLAVSLTGSFLFPAFPCLLCTAQSGLLKASTLPCIPKEKPPHIYKPRPNLTQELDHVHYPHIPWIRSSPSSSAMNKMYWKPISDTVYYRRAVEN